MSVHVAPGFDPVRSIPRLIRVRSQSYDHVDEYDVAALLEAMFEIEGTVTNRLMLTPTGRPAPGEDLAPTGARRLIEEIVSSVEARPALRIVG